MVILKFFCKGYLCISIIMLCFMIIDFYKDNKKIKLKEKELIEKAIKILKEKEEK